jgi:hypothetical protein
MGARQRHLTYPSSRALVGVILVGSSPLGTEPLRSALCTAGARTAPRAPSGSVRM